MPNTRNPSGTQTPKSGRQSQDSGRQWQGNQSQEQDDNLIEDRDDGGVEVGDPVPENDRTIRASRGQGLSNGQGETGEDEGLSGDNGDDSQGSGSERH
jgi:hypothetical protein